MNNAKDSFKFHLFKKKDVLAQLINDHVRSSTTMQTPATPSMDIGGLNDRDNNEDDDEQNFYSAPPSRMYTDISIEETTFSEL
jgi:hypothetical protein